MHDALVASLPAGSERDLGARFVIQILQFLNRSHWRALLMA